MSESKRLNKSKRKKWLHKRHKLWRDLANIVLTPYARIRYGLRLEKFKEQGDRQYLIMMNHQTPFDQFFVGMAFKGAVYYVATEDIFSNGLISRFLEYAVNPIPICKTQNDVRAVLNCMRVAAEGGTIAIAPEGNRTYSGKQCNIKPSIVQLAKKLKMPIAFFRIEGGYGAEPRWSNVIRKGGGVHAYVSEVLEPETFAGMTDEELYEKICTALNVNEATEEPTYYHKKNAEYLERLLYVCPECGLSTFRSHRDTVRCTKCGLTAKYTEHKTFEGVPYRFVADWYEAQEKYIRSFDLSDCLAAPAFTDEADLFAVELYKNKRKIGKKQKIELYGDRIVAGDHVFRFSDLRAVSVLGRNKLGITASDGTYQLKGDKRFNAIKYMHFFYHAGGETNGEFLGI